MWHTDVRSRRGTTLLEVMVSIVVCGAALGIATSAFVQSSSVQGGVTEQAARERNDNRRATLARSVVRSVVPSRDTIRTFTGTTDSARFNARCRSARGWIETCQVTLTVVGPPGARVLRIRGAHLADDALTPPLAEAELRYLSSVDEGGQWLDAWPASVRPPFAIGVIRDSAGRRDTLLLPIGSRG